MGQKFKFLVIFHFSRTTFGLNNNQTPQSSLQSRCPEHLDCRTCRNTLWLLPVLTLKFSFSNLFLEEKRESEKEELGCMSDMYWDLGRQYKCSLFEEMFPFKRRWNEKIKVNSFRLGWPKKDQFKINEGLWIIYIL